MNSSSGLAAAAAWPFAAGAQQPMPVVGYLGATSHDTGIVALMNPKSANAWPDLNETREAARALGLELAVREASSESELDAAFANFDRQRNSTIFLLADGFFRNATRACGHLSQTSAQTKCNPARKFRAVFS